MENAKKELHSIGVRASLFSIINIIVLIVFGILCAQGKNGLWRLFPMYIFFPPLCILVLGILINHYERLVAEPVLIAAVILTFIIYLVLIFDAIDYRIFHPRFGKSVELSLLIGILQLIFVFLLGGLYCNLLVKISKYKKLVRQSFNRNFDYLDKDKINSPKQINKEFQYIQPAENKKTEKTFSYDEKTPSVEKACLKCGKVNKPGAHYCQGCGQKLV